MHHVLAILKILIVVKLVILAVVGIVLFRPFMRTTLGD
jgi:hypothetical protein